MNALRICVLVIDDEAPIVRALAGGLVKHKWTITQCTDSAAAIELLEGPSEYDAILLDLFMPDHTGTEIYERLAETAPARRERTIFFTAGAHHEQIVGWLNHQGRPVLAKPVDLIEVESTIRRVVAEAKRRNVPRGPRAEPPPPSRTPSTRPPSPTSNDVATEIESKLLRAIDDRVRYPAARDLPAMSEDDPFATETGSHLIVPNEPTLRDAIDRALVERERKAALELAAGRWSTLMRLVRWGWWRAGLAVGAYGIGKGVELAIGFLSRLHR